LEVAIEMKRKTKKKIIKAACIGVSIMFLVGGPFTGFSALEREWGTKVPLGKYFSII
jgi:hypothetical protein